MKKQQSGYSLIEVLVALAITSVVLLTVVTLFYMGRRNVYSGKQMTYAVSVGTRILEDLSAMTADDIGANFNITDNTSMSTVTLTGVPGAPNSGQLQFTSSVGRDTQNISTGTDPSNYLATWKTFIDPTKLSNATVGLVITPRAPTDVAKPWTTASFVKVRVYIYWDEGPSHRRYAFFDTSMVRR